MRKPYNTTLSEETIKKAKKLRKKYGIPISQLLERAFWKVYGGDE